MRTNPYNLFHLIQEIKYLSFNCTCNAFAGSFSRKSIEYSTCVGRNICNKMYKMLAHQGSQSTLVALITAIVLNLIHHYSHNYLNSGHKCSILGQSKVHFTCISCLLWLITVQYMNKINPFVFRSCNKRKL